MEEENPQRSRNANKKGQSLQELFLPPDEENYKNHGIKNLVLKYEEFGTNIEIDQDVHKDCRFYKKHMLEG